MSHHIRNVRCSDQTSVVVLMNVKNCRDDFILILIIVENWIVIERYCNNIITLATRCWCQNPVLINNSTGTQIVLLKIVLTFMSINEVRYQDVFKLGSNLWIRMKLIKCLKCQSNNIWKRTSERCCSTNKSFHWLFLYVSLWSVFVDGTCCQFQIDIIWNIMKT